MRKFQSKIRDTDSELENLMGQYHSIEEKIAEVMRELLLELEKQEGDKLSKKIELGESKEN